MEKKCNESRSEHNRGPYCTHEEGHEGLCSWQETPSEAEPVVTEVTEESRLKQALDGFMERWQELPPLVRASCAANIVADVERHLDAMLRSAYNEKRDMPRRGNVTRLFANGYEAERQLFVELANIADEVAVANGIDLDSKYEGDRDALDTHLQRKRDARAAENDKVWEMDRGRREEVLALAKKGLEDKVVEGTAESVAKEIDEEVLGDLSKAAEGEGS